MIDLYTALKLINIFDSEDIIVYLRTKNLFEIEYEVLTVRRIKEKYDMRKTKVNEMIPYFPDGDYKGMLFTIEK